MRRLQTWPLALLLCSPAAELPVSEPAMVKRSAAAASAQRPATLNCSGGFSPGTKLQCALPVADAASAPGAPVLRAFELYLPNCSRASGAEKMPLVMHFHGQNVGPPAAASARMGDPETVPYERLADKLGFLLVYPLGLDDVAPGGQECGTGWNVLGGHEPTSCVANDSYTSQCCYASCRRLGRCTVRAPPAAAAKAKG